MRLAGEDSTITLPRMVRKSLTRRAVLPVALAICLVGGAFFVFGCGRDARLAGHNLRDPKVGPVTAYGKLLDQTATPEDVVGVLLKAVAADYAAGDDHAKRDEAIDVQFALSAPAFIKERLLKRQESNEKRLRERYYSVVYHWAPVLGHYRFQFDEEYSELTKRMHVVAQPVREGSPPLVEVLVNLDGPPPVGDVPSGPVVARIGLVKEAGFWRVWEVGWDVGMRDWHKFVHTRNVSRSKPPVADAPKPAAPQGN
jgi:hypothetical protein